MKHNQSEIKYCKTAISTLLVITLIFGLVFFSGCNNKKYDVTLKLVRRIGTWVDNYVGPIVEEYVFTPDLEDLYVEWKYDGEEYGIGVEFYNFPTHPEYKEIWFQHTVSREELYCNINLFNVDEPEASIPRIITERGNYILTVKLNEAENSLYKSRTVRLHIAVV